jgi:O-antigen/teichoic acid export membrane protein
MLSRALWTVGSFGASFSLRLLSNVVLSRLLSPSVFGVIVLVNTIRYGIELLTDVGIEQNIVHHKHGLEPRFFNTAWTLQIVRGAILSALFLALSPFLASFFGIDQTIFLIIAFAPFLTSLHSTSIFALSKTLDVKRRNLFELSADAITFALTISLALISPTIWAVLIATVLGISARSLLSYRLPHPSHRMMIDKASMRQIITYGKWIAAGSLLVYAATNLDRLVLGRLAPLDVLGMYGLARIIADLPSALTGRLSHQLVFPALAAAQASKGIERTALSRPRLRFILLGSVAIGTGIAWADVAILVLYDPRYSGAGWMLSLLLVAAWFSVAATLGEAVLLGFGRPAFMSLANLTRLIALAAGLPVAYTTYGMAGAIGAFLVAEMVRYCFINLGQARVGQVFLGQDLMGAVCAATTALAWLALRAGLDLGSPWAQIQ